MQARHDHVVPAAAAAELAERLGSPGVERLWLERSFGACKALTTLWYANRKQIPVEGIEVTVDRDDSEERKGLDRLKVILELSGPLTDQQRQQLLNVAMKCPVHRLMTQTTVEVKTELQPASV